MKPKTTLRILAGLAALILTASARAELPVIQSIQVEATNLVVTAQVPPGHVRVVLECREGLNAGTWVPVAVQRGGGEGGTITFRLPRTAEFACFRVRADATEPLPASFYTGITAFDPEPVWFAQFLFNPNPTWGGGLTTFGLASQPQSVTLMNDAAGGAPVEVRAVVESDIWRLDGDTLYFFNQNRGLQIIDVKHPDAARLRGTLNLPAVGEQMHLLPPHHVVLLTRPLCGDSNSEVLIVSVRHDDPSIVARLPVAGHITEGRLVGAALYVASEATLPLPGGAGDTWEWGTQVTSFDLAVPNAPVTRSTLWYPGRSHLVYATDTYFFVLSQYTADGQPTRVNAIDITAPDGTMNARESVTVAGYVADKFKLNWSAGVLSVISEVAGNPLVTKLETFRLSDPRSLPPSAAVKLGEVELGHGERLYATRFDGPRAYVVTFRQIDPLWVVDLSDPTRPIVSGELQVPGWSTYIHPMGNRLVTLGVETNRTTVSLFDVSDPAHPALLSRVPIGSRYSYSEASADEKAFTVLEDAGLILLPIRGPGTIHTTSVGSGNGNGTDGLQLIDLGTNSLTARGLIERDITPRRATLHRNRIISLSATELLSVDATDRDAPRLSGWLELSWPVNRVFVAGKYLLEITTDPPVVRVTPTDDPNRVLASLTLTNVPIIGATVRGNRLYLLQSVRNGLGFFNSVPIQVFPSLQVTAEVSPVVEGQTNLFPSTILSITNLTFPPTLWLSVVDLSHLPRLSVLGQTAASTSLPGWDTELEPIWPKPGLLVWAGNGGGSLGGLFPGLPNGSLAMNLSMNTSWFQPVNRLLGDGSRLLAFDVKNDDSPELVSSLNLSTNGGYYFSKSFATDGLVYLSHAAYVQLYTNTLNLTNAAICLWPTRFQGYYLDVVDYADARHPTVRPPVNIPGTLQGISHRGELLFTLGSRYNPTNWNERVEALHACAYDGISAHLVDSLSLSNVSPHPVFVSGRNIFLGRASAFGAANPIPPTLETWTLSGRGNFTKRGSVTLPGAASELVPFPGLLAAQVEGNRVMVFDDTNPARLRLVGEGPTTGCLGFNLRHGTAGAHGLWLPLEGYGVTKINLRPWGRHGSAF
jgi:hypothetical protein